MVKKPNAERKKETPSPARAIINPAKAGAMIRIPVQIAEFKATAFIITLGLMREGKSACLAG
jgi:hypothetical protein